LKGQIQRRGGHVNPPEIGSRDGVLCFGGILRFHADLRRECFGGNWDLMFFGLLVGFPREGGEEGGQLCVFVCVGGGFLGVLRCGG
jgi:hypothetical protein